MSQVGLIISGQKVPLDETESIQLTKEFGALSDISKMKAEYVRDLMVPASKEANSVLDSWFHLDVVDGLDPYTRLPAQIDVGGLQLFDGEVEIIDCVQKHGEPESYQLVFYGKIVSIVSLFADDTLRDIDYDLDHVRNATNVSDSWSLSLLSGDVVYPIVDTTGSYFFDAQQGSNKGLYRTPIVTDKLMPAILWETLMVKCFAHIGYTLSVSGGLSTLMDRAYVLPMAQAEGIQASQDNTLLASLSGYSVAGTINTEFYLQGWTEIKDTGNNFDNTGGVWTAPYSGGFQFQLNIDRLSGSAGDVGVRIKRTKPGQSAVFDILGWYGPIDVSNASGEIRPVINVDAGETIEFMLFVLAPSTLEVDLELQCIWWSSAFDDSINVRMEMCMPTMKIREFLQKTMDSMNLHLDVGEGNTATLYYAEDYLQAGSAKDWTQYIDTSSIKVCKQDVPKHVTLKHAESNDIANEAFRSAFGRSYGQLSFSNDSYEVTGEDLEIESPYVVIPTTLVEARTKAVAWGMTDHEIYKLCDSAGSAVQVPLLLFQYVGLQDTNWKWVNQTASGYTRETQWPFSRTWDSKPVTTNSFALTYVAEDVPTGETWTQKTMFSEFWAGHLRRLWNRSSKEIACKGKLPLGEWLNFRQNDTIVIAGHGYKVRKIDYDLNKEELALDLMPYETPLNVPVFEDTGNKGGAWTGTPVDMDKAMIGSMSHAGAYLRQAWNPASVGQRQVSASVLELLQMSIEPDMQKLRITSTNTYAIPDATPFVITGWDSLEFLSSTKLTGNASTGKITANQTMLVEYSVMLQLEKQNAHEVDIEIFVNGVASGEKFASYEHDEGVHFQGYLNVATGDEIDVRLEHVQGGSENIDVVQGNFVIVTR